ncbi:hypothetical protein [Sphingobacterium bovistauri]|uniref:Lipoprotein n=1 Tax=Sphingobacterium bovistauri TaxID=2781959 RepID=A0ABS7Z5H2_9SPHI|nr:hypothetical protein [Sphingobacterium bovistauri]MCA5005446.1 hypothetical protein [Sphingobacterium bovistauri]
MRTLFLLTLSVLLFGCKKANENSSNNPCHQEMKERFKTELKCTERGVMEVNLYSGIYDGKQIYFAMTMCPACNTMPPQFGYNCEGTKINISTFNTKVSEIKEIYNSCTNSFVNE